MDSKRERETKGRKEREREKGGERREKAGQFGHRRRGERATEHFVTLRRRQRGHGGLF